MARSMVPATAASSSAGSALLIASVGASLARMGPSPVRSQWALTPVAWQRLATNSTLGAWPRMYRRTVSALVPVSRPSSRKLLSPATEARRS